MSLLIENCTVKAGRRTILEIQRAEFPAHCTSAVIGPNGAGKSTLLKQFLRHSQASWCGENIKTVLRQGKIAWVGQHEQFQLPMTLSEYVLMGRYPKLAWYQRPKRADKGQALDLLAQFDLTELQNKRIETLSGGEQQRAAIVRALLQGAEVLLMDEPTNHLDVRHQHRLMHFLRSLPQNHLTVIMVLHDINLAAHYAEYILLMDQGKVVQCGQTEHVMNNDTLSRIYNWPILKHTQDNQVWFQPQTL
ncbi:MAG: ABC transporter ATP-binding protein [Neisseria sp.]|uniref:ABC transporter ATP-binding protein n=1 Tax=Neisseria sp. TaxID=192066 RepID=UPI0026DC827A|nr:ABC transporter ATP-binding protein [Neisseria sp.]MDO4640611.1 ABC transporter ATP-binding protein [Neisseria sp.]